MNGRIAMIGLLTIHDTINFGSQLQTYALYKAVESLGCEIQLIDYQCQAIAERETTLPLKDAKNPKDIVKSLILHGNLEKRSQNFHEFMSKNMKMTKRYTKEDISNTNQIFDRFLVGSDIVWGFNITRNDYTYMLDFVKNAKKYAFSSSVGTRWDSSEDKYVKELLSGFDDISVRETNASEWISDLLNKKIKVTCDPTMLWEADFWKSIALSENNSAKKRKPYVLVYMSDPENVCVKKAIRYGKKHHMPVYYINYRAPVIGTIDKRPTSLSEWIDLFMNAETVFSASYHGLLFSLYFHKRVFFFNWVNKSRMESLSKIFGIETREGTDSNIEKDEPIDYKYVDKQIDMIRNDSWKILKGMVL